MTKGFSDFFLISRNGTIDFSSDYFYELDSAFVNGADWYSISISDNELKSLQEFSAMALESLHESRTDIIRHQDWVMAKLSYKNTERIFFGKQKKVSEESNVLGFGNLLGNLPGMTYRCLLDEDWTMLYLDEKFNDLTAHNFCDFILNERFSFGSIIHEDDAVYIYNSVVTALEKKVKFNLKYRIRAKGDRILNVEETGCGLYNSHDQLIALEGYIQDISEKVRIQNEVKHEADRFKTVFQQIQNVYLETALDGTILEISPSIYGITGYKASELKGKSIELLYANISDRQKVLTKFINEGKLQDEEIPANKKDGSHWVASVRGTLLRDTDGSPLKLISSLHDVTYRVSVEEELRESRQRFMGIVNDLPHLICRFDIEGKLLFSNHLFDQTFNLKNTEGTGFYDILDTDDKIRFDSQLKRLSNNYPLLRIEQKREIVNRKSLYIDWTFRGIFNKREIVEIQAIGRDITAYKEQEIAYRESEQRYSALFRDTLSIKILLDPEDGSIYDANPAACKFYGYTYKEFLEMRVTKLNRQPWEKIRELMLLALTNKQNLFSFRHTLKNGEVRDVNTYAAPLKIGEKTYVYSIIHDITEQRESENALRESETRFRQLTESIDDVFWLREGSRFLYISPASQKMLGIKNVELLHSPQRLINFVLPEYKKAFEKKFLHELSEAGKNLEFRIFLTDGSERWLNLSSFHVPAPEGKTGRMAGLIRDITAAKIVKDSIEAKERAEESDRMKSSFLANMSHEIRTPMNAIMGFAKLLRDDAPGPEKSMEFINMICDSGEQLLNVINDIIDFSKIEANKLDITKAPFSLAEFFNEISDFYTNYLDSSEYKSIRLKVNASSDLDKAMLVSDSNRIKQILTNLISNAIKFTDKGYIEIGYKRGKGSTVIFYVKDTGLGIEKEKQKMIFERFRQVDEFFNRKYGGTGLGLSISKGLVELLGGEIWVKSEKGKGSAFFFTIPASFSIGERYDADHEKAQHEFDFKGRKVLVAEDHDMNFRLIEEILRPTGANLVHVEDGLQVLKYFEGGANADIILMDINMPELNGIDAFLELKKRGLQVPTIAQTAYALVDERQTCLSAGFENYLSKPFRKSELLEAMKKVFEK